jgi:hypothetical protein
LFGLYLYLYPVEGPRVYASLEEKGKNISHRSYHPQAQQEERMQFSKLKRGGLSPCWRNQKKAGEQHPIYLYFTSVSYVFYLWSLLIFIKVLK